MSDLCEAFRIAYGRELVSRFGVVLDGIDLLARGMSEDKQDDHLANEVHKRLTKFLLSHGYELEEHFKPFWFEGGLWFKMVNDWDDLADLINVYGGKDKVKQIIEANECVQCMNNMPFKFGHAIECNDDRSLSDYLGVSVDDVISRVGDKLNG